jgi:putative FmdB family regulatory protein
MITYVYECTNCGSNIEIQQSIKDDALVLCPECNTNSLRRVIFNPMYVRVIQEPTTLGQIAERNAKSMSRDEKSLRLEDDKTKKTINRIPEDMRPKTVEPKDSGPLPDWMEKPRTKTHTEINKLSPENVERYVYTGD